MGTRAGRIELVALGLVMLGLALLPLFAGFSGRLPDVVLRIAIYALMALGLNVVLGYTGLLDLGYVAFMATGMLVTAMCFAAVVISPADVERLMATPEGQQYLVDLGAFQLPTGGYGIASTVEVWRPFDFDGSVLIAMLLAGTVCAAMSVLRGLPTLRLVGDYYAIVTLAFAEILMIVFRSVKWTGGATSISFDGLRDIKLHLFGAPLVYSAPTYYFLVWSVLAVAVLASMGIRESRLGRALAAIRLDPIAAQTSGVHVGRYKVIAFAISGFIGGVGGSLFALLNGSFAATSVDFWQSILLVAILVLGGLGSVRGALVGAVVMVGLGELLREKLPVPSWPLGTYELVKVKEEARWLFYGAVLVLVMRFRPTGLLPHRYHGGLAPDRDAPTPLYVLGTESRTP